MNLSSKKITKEILKEGYSIVELYTLEEVSNKIFYKRFYKTHKYLKHKVLD